ncbi:MAG: ATP-dependent helicase RecG [Actinomycetota bacterium]|nr:ATP-dependent helicase RecG [Actinomycetota bacterium]
MMSTMTEDLAVTLGRVESPVLEFKRAPKDRDALRKAICALANDLVGRGGGDLLIGVDSKGNFYPVDTSDETLLGIAHIRDEGRLLERPSLTVDRAVYDGADVIRVHVSASGATPVRFDGVAWVRPGPLTARASADDERLLIERRLSVALPFDSRPLAGTGESDLDVELLRSTYIAAAVDPEVIEENDRPLSQQLRSLRLLHPTGVTTPLGIVLGGFDPTSVIPGAYLQFVRYTGVDVDAPIQDEEEIRDNLITATRTLTSILQAQVSRRVEAVDALTERTAENYPMPALREAVFNAVVHRVYDGSNAPVRILWFDDRVEVTNPGGPYGVVRQDNFDQVNDYRNPSLAAAMKTLGYVNRFGRGIERMRLQMRRNGNAPPEFEVTPSWWRVTLRAVS